MIRSELLAQVRAPPPLFLFFLVFALPAALGPESSVHASDFSLIQGIFGDFKRQQAGTVGIDEPHNGPHSSTAAGDKEAALKAWKAGDFALKLYIDTLNPEIPRSLGKLKIDETDVVPEPGAQGSTS